MIKSELIPIATKCLLFVTEIEKDRHTLVIADARADVTVQTLLASICSSGYSCDSRNLKCTCKD